MRIKRRRGDTAENNSSTLTVGRVMIDTQAKAFRIHDGVTPGGFNITTGEVLILTPGSHTLQAGDYKAGFVDEVPSNLLINGEELAIQVGVTEGEPLDNDTPWLKFNYNGKILYIPKRPIRRLSRDSLAQASLIYGDVEITVGRFTYKVRLMTGGDADPASGPGGEWNALFYPIHVDDPNDQGWGIGYTNEEIGVGGETNADRTWTQEIESEYQTYYINRGRNSITSYQYNSGNGWYGWRPVLELVGTSDLLFPLSSLGFYNDGLRPPRVYDWKYHTTG